MTWAWRTTPDGFLEVDRAGQRSVCMEFDLEHLQPAGTWERLMLPSAPAYQEALGRVLPWTELALEPAAAVGIPLHWVLAFIYAESGGRADVERVEPSGAIGVGLMALTATKAGFPGKFGITYEEAHDPQKNITAGVTLMAKFRKQKNLGLPELASAYNGGLAADGSPHTSTLSNWGLREYCAQSENPPSCCHIERVVRAANTVLQSVKDGGGIGPGPVPGPGTPPIIMPAGLGGSGKVAVFVAAAAGAYALIDWWRKRRPRRA